MTANDKAIQHNQRLQVARGLEADMPSAYDALTDRTPNVRGGSDERYTAFTIDVKVRINGPRGMTRDEIAKMCERLEACAAGRSKNREVSAFC